MRTIERDGYLRPDMAARLDDAIRRRTFLQGQCERLTGLIDWSSFNAYLASQVLDGAGRNPNVRLVRDGRDLPLSSFWTRPPGYLAASGDPQLNERALNAALRGGASVAVNRMHVSFEPASALAAALAADLGTPVQVNGYASFRPTNAFNTHWDGHDVIAVQIDGAKRWKVYRPTRPFPMKTDPGADEAFDEDAAELVWDGTLQAGQFLYVPRGWWHAVRAEEGYSFHLTVGLRPVTGIGFLHWLVEEMMDEVELRRDLPVRELGAAADDLAGRVRELVGARLDGGALHRYARAVRAHGLPKPRPSLPFVSEAEFSAEADHCLAWRNRGGMTVERTEDGVRLSDGVYLWTFAPQALPALEDLLARDALWLSDVTAADARAARLCRILVAEGVMEVRETRTRVAEAAE